MKKIIWLFIGIIIMLLVFTSCAGGGTNGLQSKDLTMNIRSVPTNGGYVKINNDPWCSEATLTTTASQYSITLQAGAFVGNTFEGWYENGTCISTENPYDFNLTKNRDLEAHFSQAMSQR